MPLLTTQSAKGYGLTTFLSAATGSFESIATYEVTSGTTSSIEFTSIPSTFEHLQLRIMAKNTNANTEMYIKLQFNGDTGNNYAFHQIYSTSANSQVDSAAYTSVNFAAIERYAGSGSGTTNVFGAGTIDILDYANTNKKTTLKTMGGQGTASGRIYFNSGLWNSTSAVTSIKLFPAESSFATYTHIALYGLKGAS